MQNPKLDRFVRVPKICELYGVKHSSWVYRHLPHLLVKNEGVTGAWESDLIAHQQSLPRLRDTAKRTGAATAARKAKKAGALS